MVDTELDLSQEAELSDILTNSPLREVGVDSSQEKLSLKFRKKFDGRIESHPKDNDLLSLSTGFHLFSSDSLLCRLEVNDLLLYRSGYYRSSFSDDDELYRCQGARVFDNLVGI
jgi:hypothetical protein